MYNKFSKKVISSGQFCLLILLLFYIHIPSQENIQNTRRIQTNEPLKTDQRRTFTDSINGRWAGFLSSDSSEKIVIGMNISVEDDSVIGNSTIQWPAKVATDIFRGKLDRRNSAVTLFESPDEKRAGVYQCKISKENNTYKITGIWTRNRDGRQFNCELDKVGKLTYATQNPAEIIKNLISNINIYCKNRDDETLKLVYSAWLSPEIRLGDFNNFKLGFSNTINDVILPDDKLNNLPGAFQQVNPYKIKEIEGVFSHVSVIHTAEEYFGSNDEIKIQNSIYKADYRLIVANGLWKILSGKVKLLNRTVESKSYTVTDFQKIFGTSLNNQITSSLEISNIFPNPANENDTITISFAQIGLEELSGMNVFFDTTRAVIVEKTMGQIKCIVPGGLSSTNPEIKLKIPDSEGLPFKSFEIIKRNPETPWYLKIPWYVVVLLLMFTIAIIIYAKYRNDKLSREKEILNQETIKLTHEKDKITSNISQFLETSDEIIQIADPAVPEELVKACNSGNCVLFISSEISALGGYPNAIDFVLNLINWSVEKGYLTNEQRELLISSVKAGRYENAAENTVINLQSKDVDVAKYVEDTYLSQKNPLPGIFEDITKTSFSFVVSSNYDDQVERAYNGSTSIYTHQNTEELKNCFTNRKFFILKIYGKPDEPNTLLLTPSQFSDVILQNFQFAQFIENVFYSRTVFCIGASIDAIEGFMNNIKVRGSGQKHYALAGVKGRGWQTSASILEQRYGVEVIPYTYGNTEQLLEFMKKLSEKAPFRSASTLIEQYSPVKKVILEDIGPFKKLELNLDKNWNILLGDNGVGKSTILKAIAVGICGDDAERYAHRLIRNNSKTRSGTVTIITRKGKYITEIKDNVTKAEIKSSMRILDAEGSLALGFPPLRTISWETKSEAYAGKSIPLPEDILPIISGEVDPRMDKLKRWLVDLKGNSTGIDPGDTREKNKYTELIEKFFSIVDDLTPNLNIKYNQINTVSKQVLIETEDGIIPIEAISQGTLSLISWIGILLQRLYEVYGDGNEDPTKRYALVLMDEIDAHMHPAWQQTLVHGLKKVFPNIQFIVSTHSPLVVGGLEPDQIFRFARDENNEVVKLELSSEDLHGRADQLLTGSLFGLQFTSDIKTNTLRERYYELNIKESLSPEEEKELEETAKKLNERILLPHEKKEARQAFELMQESVKEKLSSLTEKEKEAILKSMQVQIQQGIESPNKDKA